MPAARVGWLVARARAVAGIADRDLASTIGVPLRTVRRWERGDLVPSDDEVEAIATACGTRLTELLPRRASVGYDPATGIMRMGDQAVAMPGSMLDNDSVLAAYIGLVRRQRGLRADQDVRVRQEDLEALGEALDLDDEELEERLVRVIGISRTQAAAVRAQLLRRRLAVPMVGMLAGLSLLGMNRIFSTATEQVKTVAGGSVTRGNPYHTNPTTTTSAATNDRALIFQTPTTPPAATTTASSDAATLPPVVIAEAEVGPPVPGTEPRTGPPRTNARRDTSEPTTPPDSEPDEPTTSPATEAPPTPPATVAPTRPPETEPPTTPPPTSEPVVTTVGGGNTQDTTTVPPTTTTTTPTTDPGATTTTTVADPGITTTTSTTDSKTKGGPDDDGGTT